MSSLDHLTPVPAISQLERIMRAERLAFSAKLRASRAVLGLSQEQLGRSAGLTQRAVHCIESGAVQPKLRTIRLIQRFWQERGIAFEDLANGGFRLVVDSAVILNLDDPHASNDPVAN